jgi:hypothetical protein
LKEWTMKFDDVKRWYHVREGYWFAPKAFGLGATPVTWQGWALTLGGVAMLLLDIHFMDALVPRIIIGVAVITAFTVIAARKTDGGWRWRWGLPRS